MKIFRRKEKEWTKEIAGEGDRVTPDSKTCTVEPFKLLLDDDFRGSGSGGGSGSGVGSCFETVCKIELNHSSVKAVKA